MIPKIIHYCWIGDYPMPELAEKCISSWRKHMPDWEYKRWDETSLTQALNKKPKPNPCPEGKGDKSTLRTSAEGGEKCWLDYMPVYVKQAYEARKFAFVSDYVRLWALEQYGGLYLDVDFEVYRPFDELMDKYPAFAGYEGSKRKPIMQGVLASEPHGAWVRDMLSTYDSRTFIKPDGSLDLTPNTSYFTDRLESQGYVADGVEKDVYVEGKCFLHVFPVHYFCPQLTTGENVRNEETYCEHKGESSWAKKGGWKNRILSLVSPSMRTKLIKLKRVLLG